MLLIQIRERPKCKDIQDFTGLARTPKTPPRPVRRCRAAPGQAPPLLPDRPYPYGCGGCPAAAAEVLSGALRRLLHVLAAPVSLFTLLSFMH
jgi:hypothetical protein